MINSELKILFVSSGNSASGITTIIKNQGRSIVNKGHEVEFYAITGKGMIGYLKAIRPLRNFIKKNNFDIIHAHYSLSAFVCSLTFLKKPIVVSFMGSDILGSRAMRPLIRLFNFCSWNRTIVKSGEMKSVSGLKGANVIPNGVDFDLFRPMDKRSCQKELGWNTEKTHILFPANPSRPEKNFKLAKEAVDSLDDQNIELHFLKDIPFGQVPVWMNASDVLVLTSLWEGSPNVIKEAMACNSPIVSTDVGDVKEILGGSEGCFVTSFEPKDVAESIKMAVSFGKRTNGREDIKHLDENIISSKLIELYKTI
jgi:glycosyltransferase involved in cell wall biosynthesis